MSLNVFIPNPYTITAAPLLSLADLDGRRRTFWYGAPVPPPHSELRGHALKGNVCDPRRPRHWSVQGRMPRLLWRRGAPARGRHGHLPANRSWGGKVHDSSFSSALVLGQSDLITRCADGTTNRGPATVCFLYSGFVGCHNVRCGTHVPAFAPPRIPWIRSGLWSIETSSRKSPEPYAEGTTWHGCISPGNLSIWYFARAEHASARRSGHSLHTPLRRPGVARLCLRRGRLAAG